MKKLANARIDLNANASYNALNLSSLKFYGFFNGSSIVSIVFIKLFKLLFQINSKYSHFKTVHISLQLYQAH